MSNKYALLFVTAAIAAGCNTEVNIDTKGKADVQRNPPWQAYATHRNTGKLEAWWLYANSQGDCESLVQSNFKEAFVDRFYSNPSGCFYSGSDYFLMLYTMNTIFAGDSVRCIAKVKKVVEGYSKYHVVLKDHPSETEHYACVW